MTDQAGMAAALIIQFLVLAGLGWWIYTLEGLLEDARADRDEDRDDIAAIKAHLTGVEEPGSGRHADPEAPPYRSPTWPGTGV